MFVAPVSVTLRGSIYKPANYDCMSRAIAVLRLKPLLISYGSAREHLSFGEGSRLRDQEQEEIK